MSIKCRISFMALLFLVFSCSQKNQFPVKISEKIPSENIVLTQPLFPFASLELIDSTQKKDFGKEINELLAFKQFYEGRNEQFDLARMENLWENLKNERRNLSFESVPKWIELTGFLLETTGNELYARALEDILYQNNSQLSEAEKKEIENNLVPFIFTKNVDHIHVNVFANATIKYNHSLKGAVEITQESNFPESGKVQIKFKMEKKRYIELFIRIPEWADGATVTEHGVKYVATPGQYCLVARSWSEGDFVEVNLPVEKIPKR